MDPSEPHQRTSNGSEDLQNESGSGPPAGTSLLRDALHRLQRNRLAQFSAVVVCAMAIVGYGAPLISAYLTHFSLDEQHTSLKLAPPGTRDISLDHPSYDGDSSSFDFLDTDHSGFLECRREPIPQVVLPGLQLMDQVAPSLAQNVRTRIAKLDTKLPLSSILRLQLGTLHCPEIDRAHKAMRFFSFIFETYDTTTSRPLKPGRPLNQVVPEHTGASLHAPDGRISLAELNAALPGTIPQRYRKLGVSLHGLFAKLDRDADGLITNDEVAMATRYLRIEKQAMLDRFDSNHDLRISKVEYPGAPALHTFWLGTDGRGRDLLTRLFYGARISITIGLLATLVSFLIGVSYGGIAGFLGGRSDLVLMAIVDVLYGLPFMFIVILLIVIAGRSTINLFIALGAVQWLTMARVVRGQVLSLKQRDFVEAARALGVGRTAIIVRHLLPNTIGPVIVYSTLLVPSVILEEAFLSFLGLGVQPPEPSWGNLISEGALHIALHPWLILYPGLALGLTLFCLNFLGDGIRDALDPQMQKD